MGGRRARAGSFLAYLRIAAGRLGHSASFELFPDGNYDETDLKTPGAALRQVVFQNGCRGLLDLEEQRVTLIAALEQSDASAGSDAAQDQSVAGVPTPPAQYATPAQPQQNYAGSGPAMQAPIAPAQPAGVSDRLAQLKQLGELLSAGVLTTAEFEQEKARILSN